ncbi:hypothetical protein KC332_g1866 [Hortaea werneckii]|uniref:Uncharacterized protein n=1 Tax=Hortaea werneckii TaxID=91943 RepID=A0A3M7J3K2_HORWE|nr:hypothetical protein KC358_g1153 [Hortaea werneckii]KAI6851503.1 hypothetical protein KC350_g1596 [Hortaea werneckii]KAI6927382.1 hypothetical protein KC341_g12147 [Hortaea werneckii]KAI6949192.1 hypothetical protein KC348_g1485 [Hortaea werneckii]KAI6961627.1 hypothetical protein KC321_g12209 [Hortaea werneckii]
MKFSILTLLVAIMAATEVTAVSDHVVCYTKNSFAIDAIHAFCRSRKDIVVPSDYAHKGGVARKSGRNKSGIDYALMTNVHIDGNCKPAQWVPQKYCMFQFKNMCANAGKGYYGASEKRFGRNKCQKWSIVVKVRPKTGKVPLLTN